MHTRTICFALLFSVAGSSRSSAAPQCTPHWDHDFAQSNYLPLPDAPVYASAVFDDGSGPKLYVGGDFTHIGGVLCGGIACWNGLEWSSVGGAWSPGGSSSGAAHSVRALALFDDGSGPALYAGGSFSIQPTGGSGVGIARWNGTSWSIPGGGASGVEALAVHDDGSGPKLYVGGSLNSAGGLVASRIASWDGSSWSALGSGIGGSSFTHVAALASYDDGTGRKLFAGGRFSTAGGVSANHIARWDGAGWSSLGSGIGAPANGGVLSLQVFHDVSGTKLCVGGFFFQAGSVAAHSIATWDGASWSTLGTGFDGDVRCMTTWDDGSGSALFAGGFLAPPGGVEFGLYRWNGSAWTGVGGGVFGGAVQTLRAHDDGHGTRLFVGGAYSSTGGLATGKLTAWDGAQWSALGSAYAANGMSGPVQCMLAHDDGSGPALFVGGYFDTAGSSSVHRIAKWTSSGWSALGQGLVGSSCNSLAVFDDGSGSALYAGGEFWAAGGIIVGNLARWDGLAWSPVSAGAGLVGSTARADALAVFDDGSGAALYVAGSFASVDALPVHNIARWNGTTWADVGGGLLGAFADARALTVFDDGTGPALFAAGSFSSAGGTATNNIAKWDGTSWKALGAGLGAVPSAQVVHALAVFEDSAGTQLYAGGYFLFAGGASAASLARWNGVSWSTIPGDLAPDPNASVPFVYSLRAYDGGSGPSLSVAGQFSAAGAVLTNNIALWNGTSWSGLSSGVGAPSTQIDCQEVFDDGSAGGADLYVGGSFSSSGSVLAFDIARWDGCAETITSFCAGDGTSTACPCANSGLAGRGCDNSAATGGSLLSATGLANPDTIVLSASNELPSALSIFLQGDAQIAPVAFGDGLRCVGGHLKRLYVKSAVSGVATAPQAGDPSIHARSAALGDPISPAETRHYQTYYRDPSSSFCSAPIGGTFNVSNVIAIRW